MTKDDKIPYFPLYVDDFVSDGKVEAMETLEVGAFFLLLCKSWRERPVASIPNDPVVLSRWARVGADVWARIEGRVLAPFTLGTDNRWHQKRLRREYEQMLAHRRERQKSGKKGALAKWGKNVGEDGVANGSAIREPMAKNGSTSPPTPTDRKTKTSKSSDPRVGILVKAFHDKLTAKHPDAKANYGQLAKGIKARLGRIDENVILRCMDNWFLSTDTFILQNVNNVGLFDQKIHLLENGPIFQKNGSVASTNGRPKPGDPGFTYDDVDRVVSGFRIEKGIAKDDMSWIREMWMRQRPEAQSLLNMFAGDWRAAVDCIGYTKEKCGELPWGWTAVKNRVQDFKRERGMTNGTH